MVTNRSRGFTLIELLVVIAIIAILAAILFPVFAQAREKAREISCASNVKQMALGILMYQQDYDEYFPMGWSQSATGWYSWPTEIAPYIKSTGVMSCPDDSKAGLLTDSGAWWSPGLQISYAVNGEESADWTNDTFHLVGPMGAVNGLWDTPCLNDAQVSNCGAAQQGQASLADTQVTVPAQSILMCESWSSSQSASTNVGHGNDIFAPGYTYTDVIDANANAIPLGVQYDDTPTSAWPGGPNGATSAHGTTVTDDVGGFENFAFCDGHVKAMSPPTTFPDGWAGNNWAETNAIGNLWDATRNLTTGAQW